MKKCLHCGQENPDTNEFCSACGTQLLDQESSSSVTPEEKNVDASAASASFQMSKRKQLILAILVVIAILVLVPFIVLRCTNGSSGNIKKYVYHTESGTGDGSYFLVDFTNETYTYVGSNVYGKNTPAHGFFSGGSLKVSGMIGYEKTINGLKCYTFYDNPWDDFGYYITVDEEKGILTVSKHLTTFFNFLLAICLTVHLFREAG